MTSGVKFIFKTLIKVPVIILASYLVINILAFTFTYVKLLGFSYVVQQVAVENNYIPPEEIITLTNYLATLETDFVDNIELVLKDEENGDILPANEKRQYGMPVTVGVKAHYRFLMPLMPKEQMVDTSVGVVGYAPGQQVGETSFADSETLDARMEEYAENKDNNIEIKYTVPGLKYYPDLN